MCQCVFLDFKSGCLKIHGRTNLEPTFSPRFHSLEYLEFLWRHQFAKFFAIHDPSRHLTMKSSRLHGIWRSTNRAWVAWVMTQLMDVTALLTTRGYSATVWCFRNPKKTTTWHVWNSGKNMEYLPYQLVYHSEIVINNMKISCIQGACFEQKILKNAILPSVHLSPCFEHVLSTLKIVVFFPHRAATFLSAKSAKTEIESKPTCHVVDMYYSPQKKTISGMFLGDFKNKNIYSSWLNQPIWKICASQNGFIFPKEGWKYKIFQTTS